MYRVVKLIDKLNIRSGEVIGYIIIITGLILVSEVFMRYVLNAPTLWAHELSAYTFGVYSVFAGAYTHFKKGHVGVDLLVARFFSRRGNATLNVFTSIVFFFFLIILTLYAGEVMFTSITRLECSSTANEFPLYPLRILTFIALVLFVLQGVANLIKDFYFAFKGEEIV